MTPGQTIKFYKLYQLEGIETALWPLLYYSRDLCESYLHGNEHRQSMKRAFIIKCLSPVPDYMLSYSLLQFQYERWLFRTISGNLLKLMILLTNSIKYIYHAFM